MTRLYAWSWDGEAVDFPALRHVLRVKHDEAVKVMRELAPIAAIYAADRAYNTSRSVQSISQEFLARYDSGELTP